jgi:hypothetical protein
VAPGQSALAGDAFSVPIVLDHGTRSERVGSFALRVSWNPAVLHLDGVGSGTFGTVQWSLDSVNAGVLRLVGLAAGGAPVVSTLAVPQFSVVTADTATIVLGLNELFAAGTFADLRTVTTASGGRFCPALGRYGDVDGDGRADSRDALMVLSYAVGLPIAPHAPALGDVDGSATTTARDALIILSYAVGLDVSGTRTLALAAGACGGTPGRLALDPVGVELLPGQGAQLTASATDALGAPVALQGVEWTSSDPAVASVSGSGRVVAFGPGTALVRARRANLPDSAQTVVTVLARRSLHVVDARAAGAPNRLGSAAFPFASLTEAAQAATHDGDTVLVRAGTYQENAGVNWGAGVTVLGDTTAAVPPRVVGAGSGTGMHFLQPGPNEVRYLEVSGFDTAVVLLGNLGRARFRGFVTHDVVQAIGVVSRQLELTVTGSRLFGRASYITTFAGTGIGGGSSPALGQVNPQIDTLRVEQTEIAFFWSGIWLGADTVTLRGNVIHDFYSNGAQTSGGLTGSVAYYAEGNIIRDGRIGLQFNRPRRAVLRNNVVSVTPINGVAGVGLDVVYTDTTIRSVVELNGDSLTGSPTGITLISFTGVDSVRLNGVRLVTPKVNIQGRQVAIRNSRFLGITAMALSVTPYVSSSPTRLGLVVDSTEFSGIEQPWNTVPSLVGGVWVSGVPATLSHVTARGLYSAVTVSGDSAATVADSRFDEVRTAIRRTSPGGATASLTVSGVAVGRSYLGVDHYPTAGPLTVTGSTFTGSDNPIIVRNPAGATIRGNRLLGGAGNGIYVAALSGGGVVVDSNLVEGYAGYGIWTFRAFTQGRGNRVRNNTLGGVFVQGNSVVFTGSELSGNGGFGLYSNMGPTDATGNWWGDVSGPQCGSGCEGALGDWVAGPVTFVPWATAPIAGLPSAPPVQPSARATTVARHPSARPSASTPALPPAEPVVVITPAPQTSRLPIQ